MDTVASGSASVGWSDPLSAYAATTGASYGITPFTPGRAPISAYGSSLSAGLLLAPTTGTIEIEQDDPCGDQPQLVCLGLLYGLGDFADAGAKVLGAVAITGLGVIGLVLLALGLGIAGSGALVAGRDRYASVGD